MSVELKVPVFPESVTDGTLVCWKKKAGDPVARDEVVAEIETDKVVFEVPAEEDGILDQLLVEEGATVVSGQVIARLEKAAARAQQVEADEAAEEQEKKVVGMQAAGSGPLSPSARKMVMENQLNPELISGSGKDGRVLKEDVERYLQKVRAESATSAPAEASPAGPETLGATAQERIEKRVPMSRLRARIAERLLQSQHEAAILTTFNEINMQPVIELRARYKEKFEQVHGVRLGFMSFFIKACIEALKRFPDVNASIEDKDIIYHGYYDIGIAVGSPRGLVVPVIRDADRLSFAGIEKTISDFGQRAKSGSLTLDELKGGTFSITNGGVFGSLLSTPIINPPQSGILGMHKIEKRPVVEEDQVVVRPMMYVALSYDHRLIDGRGAVQFLVAVKELIEDPSRLLLEV